MKQSNISIDISLDEQKVPHDISWNATDSTADMKQKAKAMMLAFWDGEDKSALRIDLWTNQMMVDEMADFFYKFSVSLKKFHNAKLTCPQLRVSYCSCATF